MSALIRHCPQRLIRDEKIALHAWCKISRSLKVLVVVTRANHLYEVHEKEILASCVLKGSDNGSEEIEASIINETWSAFMDTNQGKEPLPITFRAYFSYDSSYKHLHYIIQSNEIVWVVERKTLEEQSALSLKHHYEHVVDLKVKDIDSTGRPLVYIYKLDGSEIVTDFIDRKRDLPELNKISDVPNQLSKTSLMLGHQLQMQRELHQRLLRNIGLKLRFGPSGKDSGDENPTTSECLVRYGDTWKRIHNDQLVIGVPILNSGVRQWTATDVNGSLLIPELDRFQYNVHLFKLHDDAYRFENFNELFAQASIQQPNQSISQAEWILDEEKCLLPEQTGVLIFSLALSNFQERMPLACQCFVTYTVINDFTPHDLQLYGGSISISRQFLVDEDLASIFPMESRQMYYEFLYQDLLTLAVTSNVTKWNITWENCATQSLDDFLVAELKFNILQIALSEFEESQRMDIDFQYADQSVFLYNNSGFLRNVLVRVQTESDSSKLLIIYSRTRQQALLIRDSILQDYKHSCEIKCAKLSGSSHDAMRSLLDEIAICKQLEQGRGDIHRLFKRKLTLEAQTDLLFNKIQKD